MAWHEEFWVTERLQRAHAQHNVFGRPLRRLHQPVQLARFEFTRRRLYPIPIGTQADDLEWIHQQLFKGGLQVQTKRCNLRRPKTHAQ